MKLSKNALGNLINRYEAVLKKCNLLNAFGSLAVASMLVLGGAGFAMAADSGLNWSFSTSWTSPKNDGDDEFAGKYSDTDNVTGADVKIDSDRSGKVIYGGFAEDGAAINNSLTISGGKAHDVLGGCSTDGNSNSNTVKVGLGSNISGSVAGGSTYYGDANSNTVTIENSTVTGDVYGGYSYNGNANSNTVTISSGSTVTGSVYGGRSPSGTAEGNTVILTRATVKNVYGGTAVSASNLVDNTLTIKDESTVTNDVYNFKYNG